MRGASGGSWGTARPARREELDETVQAELILALAADGKQAEAFGLLEEIRSRLADELGIDPGP